MLLTQQKFISLPAAPTWLQGAPPFLLHFQGWRMPGGVFGPMRSFAPLPALPRLRGARVFPQTTGWGAQRWPAGRAGLQGPPRSRPFQVCTGVGPGQRGPARGDSHRRCGSRAPGGSASQLQPPLRTLFFPPFPGAPQHCPAPLDTVLVCWGEPHLPQLVPIPCWPLSSCRAGSPLSHRLHQPGEILPSPCFDE